MSKRILHFIFLVVVGQSVWAQGADIFEESVVHEIYLSFEADNFWETLTLNYDNNYPDIPYIMANATIDGNQLDSIGVRLKGFSSYWGNTDKKSIKLDFNEFVSGKKYDGLKKINLNNGEGDPAMQRDKICYDILRKAGAKAPRTAYAKVYLNNQYWGLYLLVEQVDKTFIKDNFSSDKGNLFKNINNSSLEYLGTDSTAYQEFFELKVSGQAEGWDRFVHLVDVINNTPQDEFKAAIEEIFDVDLYLKILAVDVATNNWDSYIEHGRNYYMYEHPVSKKFMWIPWDYNLALGGTFSFGFGGGGGDIDDPAACQTILDGSSPYPADDSVFIAVVNQDNFCCNSEWDEICQELYDEIYANGPGGPGGSGGTGVGLGQTFEIDQKNSAKALIRKLLRVPEFEAMYYTHWCNLMDGNLSTERILPLIEQNGNLIRAAITDDPNYLWTVDIFEDDLEQGTGNLPGLRKFFEVREAELEPELAGLKECDDLISTLNFQDVVINEFMASNDSLSGLADPAGEYEDWIELYNNTDIEIDLSNAFLSDKKDNPQRWAFPQGTLIPEGGYLIVWADKDTEQEGLHADFKLSKDGDYIQLTDVDVVLDSISFGEQMTNNSFARIPNGTGDFQITSETFNGPNMTSGLNSLEASNLVKLYPNPASELINISFSHPPEIGTHAIFFNSLGQMIKNINLNNRDNAIAINELNPGMYFIHIQNKNSELISTKKLNVTQ